MNAGAWRPDLAVAWRALCVSRLLVWVAGVVAVVAFGLSDRAPDFDPAGLTEPFGEPWDTLLAPAARWDTVWFVNIADGGYDGTRAAFFPLYPLLARVAGAPLGSSLLGGLVVSWAAALAALAVVHRLALLELGDGRAARLAVWALALFPGSIFLTAVYSEAVFLLLVAGALLAARTEHWAWAGVLGALAAATRSAGLVVAVALALLWWEARPRAGARELALSCGLVPLGLGAFCLFLWLDGGDAGAPFAAQETWMRAFAGPFAGAWDGAVAAWDGARQLLSGSRTPVYFEQAGGDPFAVAGHNLKNLAALVLVAVPATLGALRRLPPAYGAYAVAALALPLSWPVGPQPLMSMPRFVAVLVPIFLWLGWWLARGAAWRVHGVLGAFAAGSALFAGQFATWHFVA
ncbi:MAG TPA: mannosyltransferase family protein [Baekduia sp.]|nr:mannosyltransferase family protein [Baekduia sp.]